MIYKINSLEKNTITQNKWKIIIITNHLTRTSNCVLPNLYSHIDIGTGVLFMSQNEITFVVIFLTVNMCLP